ncbi:MAG TPA: DUF5666 domain-containing protein [Terracidiphilus sp.]|nr:DUF5666 domain-containing protein [Terracidiphilus sp.]
MALSFALPCAAQETVEGYVTAVHGADSFDVNRVPVATSATTHYGQIGDKNPGIDVHWKDAIAVGAYLRATGARDNATKTLLADAVLLRDDTGKSLEGFAVIEKVISPGAEPVFQADGYRIRVTAATQLAFRGDLKSLTDVRPGAWIRFTGKRDSAGVLVASVARFVRGKSGTVASAAAAGPGKPALTQQTGWAKGTLIDAAGNLIPPHTKVRLEDASGWSGWHRLTSDGALQERVQRVGSSLIPAYQRELAGNDAAKIRFRFYVVDDPKLQFAFVCQQGLILVPALAVERLRDDDQLAALLADAIAFALQEQRAQMTSSAAWIANAEALDIAMFAVNPIGGLVSEGATALVLRAAQVQVRQQEERGRMDLALMADAGFDPWQAPEAWRLLDPKRLPSDPAKLKYPAISGYQLGILNLQYRPSARVALQVPANETR